MAKSLRSKVKRAFRAKKRIEGVYAATEAARLNRLNAILAGISKQRKEGSVVGDDPKTPEVDGQGSFTGHPIFVVLFELWIHNPHTSCLEAPSLMCSSLPGDLTRRAIPHEDSMDLEGSEEAQAHPETSNRVSTHGSRGSRREEWRKSKGMDPVPKRKGMNRQGGLAARRRAGRPSRRR
ncbi:hypothetical protein EDD16DRAFT_1700956 [Pisolithus croceorrhizus]|nr:hypothetical protein EDD16DRAFT_1700956 [Pisolithus croceorrhizus]KAI6162993.1 hypothetical protein EDD17DRAFT_506177 [Pisolithus thermaeus]